MQPPSFPVINPGRDPERADPTTDTAQPRALPPAGVTPSGDTSSSASSTPSAGRLLTLLLLVVAVGGAGVAYLWITLNLVLAGEATTGRLLGAAVVVLCLLALLAWLARYLGRLTPPARQSDSG